MAPLDQSALDNASPEEIEALYGQLSTRFAFQAAITETKRREWLRDPALFIKERLGEFVWSRQREILESIRDNRLTAVPSCHNSGKTWLAARAVLWWIETHPPGTARVVTTAATAAQVEAALWFEIRRGHVAGKLSGRMNRTQWVRSIPGGAANSEEVIAFGHRPKDDDPTAMHSVHARFVLVVFDEAGGIPKTLWDAASSLVSNKDSRWLAIGQPESEHFATICKPGSGWNVLRISAFDTPNVSMCPNEDRGDGQPCGWRGDRDGDGSGKCPDCQHQLPVKEEVPEEIRSVLVSPHYVADGERMWGRTHPLYISKILGDFPDFSSDGLIPTHWIRAAQMRWGEGPPKDGAASPVELGVDVGAGGDKNVIALRQGIYVKIVSEDKNPDTTKTAGNVARWLKNTPRCGCAKIEYVGIGRGVVDILSSQKLPAVPVPVGDQAENSEAYANLRAEAWWMLREVFQAGLIAIDPEDEELAAQLIEMRYEVTVTGKVQIETKRAMRARGRPSPDRADALMLAMYPSDHGKKDLHVTWGRDLPKKVRSLVEPEYAP